MLSCCLTRLDQPFINQLEMKNEGIKFQRIDADLTDTFKGKDLQEDPGRAERPVRGASEAGPQGA